MFISAYTESRIEWLRAGVPGKGTAGDKNIRKLG